MRFIEIEPESNWIKSSSDDILDSLLKNNLDNKKIFEIFDSLSTAEPVYIPFIRDDTWNFYKILQDTDFGSIVFNLLYHSGYITKHGENYKITNNEILHFFQIEIPVC